MTYEKTIKIIMDDSKSVDNQDLIKKALALYLDEGEDIKICSKCDKPMYEGFIFDNGEAYYCTEKCLYKDFTKEEWKEAYDDGNSDSYWTSWVGC